MRASASLTVLIVLVCVVASMGIWATALQRIAFEREQALAAAKKANANLAIAFEQQVFRTLKAAEQVAAFVREQYRLHGAAIDLHAWVERGVIREAMFTIVSVVDEQGDIVASSTPQAAGRVNYADREFFKAQRQADQDLLFISPPVLGRVSGRWQVPMSLRITRPDGRFGGVVVMSVDPTNFTDFHRQAALGDAGLLELTGLDGVVRGRKLGGVTSFGSDATSFEWFQRRQTAPEGELLDEAGTLDGVARIVSYRTMAGYPLMVAVGTSYDAEMAAALQRRTTYLVVAAIATAGLLLAGGLLIAMLARQRRVAEAQQASEALFKATFHQAAMGIMHVAPDGRILRANDKLCRLLGYTEPELNARTVFDLGEPAHREEARQFLAHRLSAASPVFSPEIEKPYRRKDGTVLWVCEALGVVKDPAGRPDFLVAVVQDITARKDLEARLSYDALHDALTGLPNRVMFEDRFERVLESARRHDRLAAMLYIDLDGFKAVNDSRGHAAGDLLLQQVARRLEACVRAEDTVARFGGDEFGIILTVLTQEDDAEVVALKVLHALSEPFGLDGDPVSISGSVGAALFPLHGRDLASLVAHADRAMYAAKAAGRNRFSWAEADSRHDA